MDLPNPDTLNIPENIENPTEGTSQVTESQSSQGTQEQTQPSAAQQALIDLDKAEKVRFQGKEWSRQDLEKAMLRQEDYTKKTQGLSEERKTFAQEQKYYENLYADLDLVRKNPSLANEFIKTYPQKFHSYLKNVLNEGQDTKTETKPQYDVDTQSKLSKLENYVHEQEVAKNETRINGYVETYSKKYPNAFPELALANIYKAYQEGEPISEELFERSFKDVDAMVESRFKTKYSDLVKKQTTANKKGQDVDSGGGTPGKAPQKFKSMDEVERFMKQDMNKR